MTLEEVRREIDAIDSQLLPLFLKRMDCARQVAEIKRGQNLPVLNSAREQEILDSMAQHAGSYAGEARMLYATMMDMSRALQHNLLGSGKELRKLVETADPAPEKTDRIACLGVNGSFSHEAVKGLYPQAEPVFFDNFASIFAAVAGGEADLGVLPVENSSAGSVSEVYDLILQYRFYIVAAETLQIHNCLAAPEGTQIEDVHTAYTHPQPIAQCSNFIAKHRLQTVPCSATAAAAQKVARERQHGTAAICSEPAAQEYGLHILAKDIQNSSNNCTRFIAISRRMFIPQGANKISLCFSLPHRTGTLHGVLARFAAAGLNLTKIESRPIAGKTFEYDFYLDFTGNVLEPYTLDLIAALSDELPRFSFLGNYLEQE